MPHTTLMHLLWTWLLLESQKGATLYVIVMFLEQQLLGNFTEYRTQKLEPNYSMNTKSYGSDYNIYFTSCTIRYHSQWDRKHSGYPCQCIQVLPAWLSPVFIRLAWGWAFLRWTVKKRNKKKSCLDLVEECEVCRFWAISAAANLSFLPDEIL